MKSIAKKTKKNISGALVLTVFVLIGVGLSQVQAASKIERACTFKDTPLYGKVKIVEHFPDFKVKIVEHFPDLKVRSVKHFADSCGKWQIVKYGEDFKVQYVEYFEDFKVQMVEYFPGLP